MFCGCFFFCFIIIVSLNVRGLGKPEKRLAVKKLVKNYKIDYLMLQETKVVSDIHRFVHEVWGKSRCGWNEVPSFGALEG